MTNLQNVHSGKSMVEFDAESGNAEIHNPNRILVIDWKGNFRYDITLDHGIISADLDKTKKHLICDTKAFDNYLISYDLSGLYKN
ncbi:MAG: hypothetical protein JW861_00815 [Bacteroidales bacterium]|nr:hypothetical protein [Bacteroidales bacterium]